MDNPVYRKIKREFDIKRQIKLDEAINNKNNIYKQLPEIKALEEKLNELAIKTTKQILNSDSITRDVEQENFRLKMQEINRKIELELKKNNLTRKDLEPNFECIECKDTGVVQEGKKTSFCNCFKQALINATYEQSNINKIEDENFTTFDIGYYSKVADKKKYGIDKSPLENIECIKKLSLEFCQNIEKQEQKNLLFVGNTGLGKTFLANAIAREVIKKGKSVVYQTAPILMDKVVSYKFSYDKQSAEKEQYNKIFDVDLLIIDDLGTEMMSNIKFTELFNIINTRLLRNKKILISTNLTLNELYKAYDERVMSRLIGNFTICKFVGEDIRLKKKRLVD